MLAHTQRFNAHPVVAPTTTTTPVYRRRPLVHAILLRHLIVDDNARLFAYARDVLHLFAARGVDVYLQTDISDPTTATPRPITYKLLDDVVNSSTVDFVILITEQNIARNTINARIHNQFVEREIDKHATFVLESWATSIAREASPDELFSLQMNPNVVTNKHIDFFLQQHPILRGIRSAYAKLTRLVDSTQKWLVDSEQTLDFVSVTARISNPPNGTQTREIPNTELGSSTSDDSTPGTSDEKRPTETTQPLESAVDQSALKIPKDKWEALAKKALRQGLESIFAENSKNQKEDDILKVATPRMSRIKRGTQPSARLLRGQFLVRSLHNRLVQAFPDISSAPVAMPPDLVPTDVYSVPSEAHRQRLLREVNFLVGRMEELGSRLSRRPKTRRRRRITSPVNPWSSYIDHFRSLNPQTATTDSKLPEQRKDGNTYQIDIDPKEAWRCTGCHSLNRRNCSHCRSCGAPSCVLERGLLPNDSDAMASAIRDAIKLSGQQRRPWIFGPTPVQVSSPPNNSGNGRGNIRRVENGSFPVNRGPVHDPLRAPHLSGPSTFHGSGGNQLSPEFVESMRGLSVDDGGIGIGGGNGRTVHGRIYENPSSSLDSAHGIMANIPHILGPNGSGLSKVRAIPISRPKGRSPPSRSPGATDFQPPRRRLMDDLRPSSFDANMLGNSFGPHHRNGWLSDNGANGESSISAARSAQSFSRSPPMFGSSRNGFPAPPNGSMFDSRSQMKRNDMRIDDISFQMNGGVGRGGRYPPRPQDHFTTTPLMNGNGTMPAHSVSHMEELAVGSVEAQRYIGSNAHSSFPPLEQRSSLEDLAAASDAANGGLGSATSESMRAVMAYRTDFDQSGDRRRNGGYGLF